MVHPDLNKPRHANTLDSSPKNELGERLNTLHVGGPEPHEVRPDDTTHNLQVYQIELEMQNRALRDAQFQLEVAFRRYSDLFEDAPVGYCIIDKDAKFLKVNRTAEQMLRSARALDHNVTLGECAAPQDRTVIARHLKACLRARRELAVEVRSIGHLKRMFHVHLASVPEFDGDGELIGFKVALIDISQRKAAEARLQLMSRASETLASSLNYVNSVSAMLAHLQTHFAQACFVDLHVDERDALRLYPATLGSNEASAYAAEAEALFPQHQKHTPQAQVFASGLPMRTAGLPQEGEQIAPEIADGGRSVLVVPLVAHGKTLGTMTCIANAGQTYESADLNASSDLGHRVAMAVHSGVLHEQVQQAVQARQMILATVSHDVKNVLTSVRMRGELLLDSVDPYASKQGMAIDRLVIRMDKMLDDLMDIASIERGQLSMRPGTQEAGALVTEAIESCRQEALTRNICLQADVPSLWIFCDAERFLQVLSNLLSNAIKFSPNGGRVSVSVSEDGGLARIAVADRGPGIAPELIARVFDQYWQAPESRVKGRGLGLAISQGIVEAGGGQIWVESQLGSGSTFYFTAPIARRGRGPNAATASHQDILVAEDDDDLRLAACEILREEGYQVQSAYNGQEALRLSRLASPPIALVLLDLEMPVLSGWDFLRARQNDPALQQTKVVVMSALSAAKEPVARFGASFLNKPLRAQHLVERVKIELQHEAPEPIV